MHKAMDAMMKIWKNYVSNYCVKMQNMNMSVLYKLTERERINTRRKEREIDRDNVEKNE